MFSKKASKIDKIFTVDLTLCSKCQIDGTDFFNFCVLLRKHELYLANTNTSMYSRVPNKQTGRLLENFRKSHLYALI